MTGHDMTVRGMTGHGMMVHDTMVRGMTGHGSLPQKRLSSRLSLSSTYYPPPFICNL